MYKNPPQGTYLTHCGRRAVKCPSSVSRSMNLFIRREFVLRAHVNIFMLSGSFFLCAFVHFCSSVCIIACMCIYLSNSYVLSQSRVNVYWCSLYFFST